MDFVAPFMLLRGLGNLLIKGSNAATKGLVQP